MSFAYVRAKIETQVSSAFSALTPAVPVVFDNVQETPPSVRVVEGEGGDGGTGPDPQVSSSGGQDGRQGLRAISSRRSSSRRVTPFSGPPPPPLPPISAEQRSV